MLTFFEKWFGSNEIGDSIHPFGVRSLIAGANITLTPSNGKGDVQIDATGGSSSPLTTKGDIYGFSTVGDRLPVGGDGLILVADSTQPMGIKWASVAGTGDVVGPASATDNAVVRFDLTTGKLIQNSVVTISDTGDIAGVLTYTTSPIKGASGGFGSNLLTDGGFESWTNPSTPTNGATGQVIGTGTVSEENSIVYAGSHSIHFQGDGGLGMGPPNVAFYQFESHSGLTPADTSVFKVYQRNDSGTGNGLLSIMRFNGNPDSGATQVYNYNTPAWESYTNWATLVGGGSIQHYFGGSATETTTFTQISDSVPVPANGTIVAVLAGVPQGSGAFSVYGDAATLQIQTTAALINALIFLNPSDPANIVAGDTLIEFALTGGSGAQLLKLTGDGKWSTDLGSFDFSSKVVKVGTPSTTTDAVNVTYYNTNMFALPSQGGNSGKVLTTDGTNPSWASVSGGVASLTDAFYANQGTTFQVLHGNAAGNLSWSQIALSSDVSGQLPIGNGGHGQATAQAGFDALSPLTTLGDLLIFNGTHNDRFAGNTAASTLFLAQTGDGVNVTGMAWTAAGSVTDVSVATANGFAGTVANSTTTPAITLTTSITGILQGNGTAISAAGTTGSGNVVLDTSPSFTTPDIGSASGSGLSLSGLTASQAVVTDGSKNLASLAYGTASSASSLVERDSNQNAFANNFTSKATNVSSAGATTTLTPASARWQNLTGSANQTFQLPDATTLTIGSNWQFNNNSTGILTVVDGSSGALFTLPAGGQGFATLVVNVITAGVWDKHFALPANASFGTTGLTITGDISATTYGGQTVNWGAGGTLAYLTNSLSDFAVPSADVPWNSKKITGLADPGSAQDAATQNYVLNSIAPFTGATSLKHTVRLTSAAALDTSTYSNGSSGVGATLTATANGALSVDGISAVNGDRILVKDQASPLENGIYVVTDAGSGSTPWIITRATDSDTSAEIIFEFFFTREGSTNSSLGFLNTNTTAITIGTDSITYTVFSASGTYTAGTGLYLSGGAFYIDTSVTADLISTQTLLNKTLTSPVINSPTGITATDVGLSNVTNDAQIPMSYLDTDGTLAADSDAKVASQKAVKTYADTKVTANAPITGATHTKVTYDINGLVTAGSDATTTDIAEGTHLYYTDARARASVSATGTGLTYDNSTGIFTFDQTALNINSIGGGPLAIAGGGSGQATANAALNAFLPTQTALVGYVLKTDGTDTSWLQLPDFTTFMTLAGAEHVTGAKSFDSSKLILNGATSGTLTVNAAAVAGTHIATYQAATGTIALLGNSLSDFAGPSGDVAWNSHKITGLLDPTNPQDAATKAYADAVAQGLLLKQFCILATAAALPTVTYNNGTSGLGATLTASATGVLTVDGVTVALNDRVLIKDQASGLENGIYDCTTAGAVGVAFILTRATDSDSGSQIRSEYTFIVNGSVNANKGFVNTNPTAPTMGTTAITYTIFSSPATYAAGTGLTLIGSTFSIDTSITVDKTTVQTLTNKTLTAPVLNNPTGLTSTDVGLNNVTNVAQLPASYLDTDGTLAANSDTKVASQKATKTYADTKIAKLTAITPGTFTKITYNASGLVTGGSAATTADIGESGNLYYTDARARAAVSATGTGLTYSSSTGIFTFAQGSLDKNALGGSVLSQANGGTGLATFTAGQLLFGALLQDSNLFWDNTNKRLSLGAGSSPTAILHLKAGTASASTGPLKFTVSGAVLLSTPEAGVVEPDSSGNLYYTDATPTRQTIATTSSAQTFSNKRVAKRVVSIASSATPTPNADITDIYKVTALAVGATFGAPTGTPQDGDLLEKIIKDNGTAQTLAFNAIYNFSSDLIAPTTTVLGKTLVMLFQYNSVAVKWNCIAWINNF